MIITRRISLRKLIGFTRRNLTILVIFTVVSLLAVPFINDQTLRALSYASGFLGTALAFLIGFRNNAAYGRWWEAQQLWSQLKYESRNLALLMCTFLPDTDDNRNRRQRILHRQIAFAWRLNRHLRQQPPDDVNAGLLDEAERKEVEALQNPPLALLNNQGKDIRALFEEGVVDSYKQVQLANTLTSFNTVLSGCERLKKTPFPMQYTWFMAYSLMVFLFILPLSLAGHLGYWSAPFSLLIGYVFVMLEYVGRYIEHPFENSVNDVPMDYISRTIEIDLRQILGESNIPTPIEPQGLGYLY